MAAPSRVGGLRCDALPPRDEKGRHLAVIEAAAGTGAKYKFEPALGAFVLHSLLPPGLAFPYAFGFLPSTCADDGDPLDVLVPVDAPVPPGSVVPVRLLVILEARQEARGGDVRNDRIVAAADVPLRRRRDGGGAGVPAAVRAAVEAFFVRYHRDKGRAFEPLRWRGRGAALRAAAAGHAQWRGV